MSDRAQEGVLLLMLAAGIFLLWLRGYLTPYITAAAGAIAQAPAKVPFTIPGATGGGGARVA